VGTVGAVQGCSTTRDLGDFTAMVVSQEGSLVVQSRADMVGWVSRKRKGLIPRPVQLIKSNVLYKTSLNKRMEHGHVTQPRSAKRNLLREPEVKKSALPMGNHGRYQISSKMRMGIGPALRGHVARLLIRIIIEGEVAMVGDTGNFQEILDMGEVFEVVSEVAFGDADVDEDAAVDTDGGMAGATVRAHLEVGVGGS